MTVIYQGGGITEYHLNSGQVLILNEQEMNELTEEMGDTLEFLEISLEQKDELLEEQEDTIQYLRDWVDDESKVINP